MAEFVPVLELFSLNGSNGFQINGAAGKDYSGCSVASAGDMNGDGFADILIGADGADGNTGATYVVFGKDTGFATNIGLGELNGTTGFKIKGESAGDGSGFSVASAGDINKDGYDDIIIGAHLADATSGSSSGASYVVFGSSAAFDPVIDLSTLSGTAGFKISGSANYDKSGRSVASAGDVNGDTIDDLLIGGFNGSSFVVFGKQGSSQGNINLAVADAAVGFRIKTTAGDFSGSTVASAGDINGDGLADLILGAPRADQATLNVYDNGASYIVFGKSTSFGTEIDLAAIDGSVIRIDGEFGFDASGNSVASAGDFNGDGFDDIIIGAYKAVGNRGASHVVFGKETGWANFNLASLSGSDGFQITGETGGNFSGESVASAGDINGDGFDDIIIGASFVNGLYGPRIGASYVLFGKAGAFDANVDLSTLDGTTGFKINGKAAYDESGGSVASAGDVNGDGFDDLIIGAQGADQSGVTEKGASYVIFGKINILNGTPAGSDKLITILEDGSYTFAAGDFGFTDSDNNALTAVIITTISGNGTLKLNNVNVTLNQKIPLADFGSLIWKPADNANGDGLGSVGFKVVDNGATDGKQNIDKTANAITFNVTSVVDTGENTAPSGADKIIIVNEGTSIALSGADFGFSDVDFHLFSSVVIDTISANGSLQFDGSAAFQGQEILVADIGKLTFKGAEGAFGNNYANFTFRVKDSGGMIIGGSDTDPTANKITFNVAPVNDAPSGADKILSTKEDVAVILTPADFGFSDTDGNTLLSVIIDAPATKGTLKFDGVAVTQGQEILAIDFGKLTFTAAQDQYGMSYDSFTFKVKDSGSTANGGIDTDPSANAMTFDITPVIDKRIGKATNEKLIGTLGDDYFDGKAGNDLMIGNGGQDKFVFKTGYDRDLIKDFGATGKVHDTLDIRRLNSIVNYTDLVKNHAKQVKGDVVIDGLNGDRITLKNVDIDDLGKTDFLF